MADFYVMRNLNEVVKLDAMVDMGRAHCGAVAGGIRTDLYIIFHNNNSYLLDFVIYTGSVRGESESVGTDDSSGMDYAAIAYLAVVIYLGSGVDDGIIADNHAVADISLRINLYAFADNSPFADISEGSDVAIIRDNDTVGYMARLLYAGGIWLYELRRKAKKPIRFIFSYIP